MSTIDDCDCCQAAAPMTPEPIGNRPALPAITYRIGSFASFRETMLLDLQRQLPELTTRSGDDHAITLLELWAALGDVLTFYQERIANEAFLRTATERESVRRLAALLDYRPRAGLSAETDVAFILDQGAALVLQPGLRLMSLPAADQQPAIFETLEPCQAMAALNRLPSLPVPVADRPIESGRRSALLTSAPAALAAGDRLVFFTTTVMEEKTVTAVETIEGMHQVTWSTALINDFTGGQIFRVLRPLRFFGWNAPDKYPHYQPGTYNTGTGKWNPPPLWTEETTIGLDLPDGLGTPGQPFIWPLEARIAGLGAGAQLLVAHDGKVELGTVTSVTEAPGTVGPLTDTVTVVTLSSEVTKVTNRRNARILEVEPGPIVPRKWTYPAQLSGGRMTLRPQPQVRLAKKRKILIDDGNGHVHVAHVTGSEPVGDFPDHLAVDFSPPLALALDAHKAVMYGNVARAGHGETQMQETLGDGDGGALFQSFGLARSPLTRLPSARDIGGLAALDVLVDEVRWQEVPSLSGQTADARVYTLRNEADGMTRIRFGDGTSGARLPSGRGNVVARYRQGLGQVGMLEAGQLSVLLSRPPGLRDALNPAAAEAGADPEPLDQARSNAPASVLTFGRIVAIDDFAHLATISGEIAKARADWVWRRLDRIVHLTIAAQGGGDLSTVAMARLHAALDGARDPNHLLLLGNAVRVPLQIAAKLVVADDHERDVVMATARSALLRLFSFAVAELGQAVHASRVITVLQTIEGVVGLDLDVLHFKDASSWSAAALAVRGASTRPDQPHLRIFAARAPLAATGDPLAQDLLTAGVEIVPAEIATLADADLQLSASGGIA